MALLEPINVNDIPRGLTKKELIKLPALKKIKSWFTWAGIVEIATGVLNFATVGELAEMSAKGYPVNEGYMMLVALLSILFIGLGIALLVTKSTVLAYIAGVLGILMAVLALATGGHVGAGIVASVLAFIGAYTLDKAWKEYSSQN